MWTYKLQESTENIENDVPAFGIPVYTYSVHFCARALGLRADVNSMGASLKMAVLSGSWLYCFKSDLPKDRAGFILPNVGCLLYIMVQAEGFKS